MQRSSPFSGLFSCVFVQSSRSKASDFSWRLRRIAPGNLDEEASAEVIEGEGDGEDVQENGEEEVADEDPILELFEEENLEAEAAMSEVQDLDPAVPAPSTPQAVANVVDLDPVQPREAVANVVDLDPVQPPPDPVEPLERPRAIAAPPLARRLVPGRRHEQHEKSFEFGVFFVKYRDGKSDLYPDRIPAWTVECPVHENCNLVPTSQLDFVFNRLLASCTWRLSRRASNGY